MTMLAIQSTLTSKVCTPNLLPCRVHHDGPAKVTKRYWSPRDENGTRSVHFRGRKLKSRALHLPAGYQGKVLKVTAKVLPEASHPIEQDEEIEPHEPVKIMEEVATFDGILMWDHDSVPQADENMVKGLEEWVTLAQAIHGEDSISQ